MASQKINEAKRDLMSRAVEAALARGWTVEQLAAVMLVTKGTIRQWRAGNSMGTNAQRAELANLRFPEEERPRLRKLAATWREEAAKRDRDAAKAHAANAHLVAEMHQNARKRLLARAKAFESV